MSLTWSDVVAAVADAGLADGDCLLFGSVPMAAHGLVAEVGDIDVVARGEAWERTVATAAAESALLGDRVVRLPGGIEVFNGWHGSPAGPLFDRASVVDGLVVASLGDVLAFKLALGRPKDAAHIALLQAALADGAES